MTSRPAPRARLGAALLLALGSAAAHAGAGGRLTVVLDRDNLPYSAQHGPERGMDYEIAEELARRLGLTLQPIWIETLEEGLLTIVVGAVRTGPRADLAVGAPIEPRAVEDRLAVGKLALYSAPYASTGYVVATRAEARNLIRLEEIGRAEIGVEIGSVGGHELWNSGFLVRRFGAQDRVLEAIASGRLDFGLVWASAGWRIQRSEPWRDRLKLHAVQPTLRGMRWNLAVAAAPERKELLERVDPALDSMKREGRLREIFARYHVPYFDPLPAGEETPR